ncbi:MAG: HAD family hydrolase [Victivallaceae bacterium]|nr:HAD family hydrolase [Victivallaceae bacterium]
MKYISNFLELLEEKLPLPTGVRPKYSHDDSIKAVIFDIYGTLMISASGDIEEAEMSAKNIITAFDAVGVEIKTDIVDDGATLILTEFTREIKRSLRKYRQKGLFYPEIDIRKVWQVIFDNAARCGLISAVPGDEVINAVAFIFELLSNPVWPMPNMRAVLQQLKDQKIPVGIVSNAQFYTPPIMNHFMTGEMSHQETIFAVDDDIAVYSYQLRRGKPDVFLYEQLLEALYEKYHIRAHEAIFVGNDMKKDIMAAQEAGFKTVLFAGDMRSLRMRGNDPEVQGIIPDHVITELGQILDIIGITATCCNNLATTY